LQHGWQPKPSSHSPSTTDARSLECQIASTCAAKQSWSPKPLGQQKLKSHKWHKNLATLNLGLRKVCMVESCIFLCNSGFRHLENLPHLWEIVRNHKHENQTNLPEQTALAFFFGGRCTHWRNMAGQRMGWSVKKCTVLPWKNGSKTVLLNQKKCASSLHITLFLEHIHTHQNLVMSSTNDTWNDQFSC